MVVSKSAIFFGLFPLSVTVASLTRTIETLDHQPFSMVDSFSAASLCSVSTSAQKRECPVTHTLRHNVSMGGSDDAYFALTGDEMKEYANHQRAFRRVV